MYTLISSSVVLDNICSVQSLSCDLTVYAVYTCMCVFSNKVCISSEVENAVLASV